MHTPICHRLAGYAPTSAVADALVQAAPVGGRTAGFSAHRASPEVQLAAARSSTVTARLIAEDRLTPADVLTQLAQDTYAQAHVALAANPSLPDPVRQRLWARAEQTADADLAIALLHGGDPAAALPAVLRLTAGQRYRSDAIWDALSVSVRASTTDELARVAATLAEHAQIETLADLARHLAWAAAPADTLRVLGAVPEAAHAALHHDLVTSGSLPDPLGQWVATYLRNHPDEPAPEAKDVAGMWDLGADGIRALARCGHPAGATILLWADPGRGQTPQPAPSRRDTSERDRVLAAELDALLEHADTDTLERLLSPSLAGLAAHLEARHLEQVASKLHARHSLSFVGVRPDVWAQLPADVVTTLTISDRDWAGVQSWLCGERGHTPRVEDLERLAAAPASVAPSDQPLTIAQLLSPVASELDKIDPWSAAADVVLDAGGPALLRPVSTVDGADARVVWVAERITARFGTDPRAWTTVALLAETSDGSWSEVLDAAAALLSPSPA